MAICQPSAKRNMTRYNDTSGAESVQLATVELPDLYVGAEFLSEGLVYFNKLVLTRVELYLSYSLYNLYNN
jgi:hypothetical protein